MVYSDSIGTHVKDHIDQNLRGFHYLRGFHTKDSDRPSVTLRNQDMVDGTSDVVKLGATNDRRRPA